VPTSKIVTEEKNKPSLDEQTFGKLIEAAYVLQEHNREMRLLEESLELHSERLRQQEAESQQAQANNLQTVDEPVSRDSDYTLTLAEIVEAQHQIQIRHLEKDAAMAVVAERIVRITRASGAGIAILDDKTIRYRAGAGSTALPVGSETPLAKAICATCVRTGQVLRTLDVNTEFLFDPDLCRGRGIFSLVAVPVYHNGEIVGALELYFEKLNGFAEQDIHTCQLMAGLVTEAIGRDSESSLKQSMAAERSSMLAAIEKLRPSLIAMAEDRSTEQPAEDVHSHSLLTPSASVCWKCGESQIEHEQFCGKCGAALVGDTDPTSFQSEVAATWYSQPTNLNDQVRGQVRDQATPANGAPPWHASAFAAAPRTPVTEESAGHSLAGAGPSYDFQGDDGSRFSMQTMAASPGEPSVPAPSSRIETRLELSPPKTLLPEPSSDSAQQDVTWTSAAKARDFLEGLSETRSQGFFGRFWNARRGYIYLAVALIFVAIIVRWGFISAHPSGAADQTGISKASRKPAPDADLSLFDKFLISIGLAEAPQAPQSKGNPETQVWVDLHTALYYCPGSELYGKTPKGGFESQRDAQMDQFEPASRKACD